MTTNPINMWLDDVRPAPHDWVWVKNIDDAKKLLESGRVVQASLDHDLGVSPPCYNCENTFGEDPNSCGCGCHQPLPSGYDLVKWCAEHNIWPHQKPLVHSMNPVGRKNMVETIDRYFQVPHAG